MTTWTLLYIKLARFVSCSYDIAFHYFNSQPFKNYTDQAKKCYFLHCLEATATSHGQRTEVYSSVYNNILGTLRYFETATWKTIASVASQVK